MAKGEAMAAALGTVDMVSWVGQMAAMHPAAAMTGDERTAIAAPLSRIYEKNSQMATAVSRYADPLALMTAAGAWMFRVYVVRQQGGPQAQQQQYQPSEFASNAFDEVLSNQPMPAAARPAAPVADIPEGGRDNSSVMAAIGRMSRG